VVKKNAATDGSQTYLRPFSLQLAIAFIVVILLCVLVMTTINYIRKQTETSDQKFYFKMSIMTAIHGSFCQGMKPLKSKIIKLAKFIDNFTRYTR
jgi:hypothetical protein